MRKRVKGNVWVETLLETVKREKAIKGDPIVSPTFLWGISFTVGTVCHFVSLQVQ